MTKLTDLIVFNDRQLAARYAVGKIPMATLLEAYLDGALDIPNMDAFLDSRKDLVDFTLTKKHFEFFFTRMIPEVAIHSKSQDRRIVREHYDRGDDFFEAFLGERMVYTSGIFQDDHETVEQAQDNKMDLVCRKLMLKPGQEMLDIGCGWGTLALHAAKQYGANSTGITISKNQTTFGNGRIAKAGLSDRARLECLDYRDIPNRQWDRIASLEMVEHVGVKNLSKYCRLVYDRLKDDGIFLLQWVGLRRGGDLGVPVIGLRPEDLVWGLFMSKYIFPGADASIPLSDMAKALEKAGFQIQSVENISIHYSDTIRLWHQNWQKHKEQVLRSYGERWYRLWHLFLGWSWRIAAQGTGQGFQIVAHKNLDTFDRKMFTRRAAVSPVRHERDARAPALSVNGNGVHVADAE
ncbi:MAG TPA: cyclopropane-fatty-acyl-phospholipid synthase family protein [Polyangiaceae bacterium]|nr:cyclopropane-fatty-acyl-phospholipid synthase family protein [Polyangiaceae bacterium]